VTTGTIQREAKDQRSASKLNPYCLSSDEAGVRLSMSDNSTAYGVRDNESLCCLSVPRAVTTVRLIGSQPVTDRAQWRQSLPLTAYAVRAQCL
jgi:type IV secretory pathway TrbF-like protein